MHSQRGTMMVELMIALVFLAVTASVMMRGVASLSTASAVARDRALILSYMKSRIEMIKAKARTTALTPGSTSTTPTLRQVAYPLTCTEDIALEPGFTNLYRVKVIGGWTVGSRGQNMKLETLVVAPDE
ncbi:MAG: hypothetical protein ABL949_10020 [Fimbriimonadaceae bacterium]